MTTLSLTKDGDWKTLRSFLPAEYERLAHVHKQLEAQYGNAKITTADWLLRFILLHAGADLPLRQTVAMIAEAGGPRLSAMRLHMKMRRASPYLQDLVERMVGWSAQAKPERWAGYCLTLVDATSLSGPGAVGSDARIHTKLRAADVAVLDAVVTDVTVGETLRRFSFDPGELVLGDRVYSSPPGIAHVLRQEADVLVRYNRGSLPLSFEGVPLDVLGCVGLLREEGAVRDVDVTFEHGEERFPGRLIAMRLSAAATERARKRLRKEQGASLTRESLEAAPYVMLFTTVPRERLSAGQCLEAYRLRWQIELHFKRWKSLCRFDRLPNYRDDTIVAWLNAKVLLGVLLDRMSSIRGELFPPVRLAVIQRPPRRKRLAPDGTSTVEAHQRDVAPPGSGAPSAHPT